MNEEKKKSKQIPVVINKDFENEIIKGVNNEINTKIEKLPINNKVVIKALQEGEDGDAYLLIKCIKDQYIYDRASGEWYYWNTHFWRMDKLNHVVNMTKKVINLYGEQKIFEIFSLQQAESDNNEKIIKQHKYYIKLLDQQIKSLRTLKKKTSVLKLAASGVNSLGMTGEDWDKQPMLLCCWNGCIDLKNGIFNPGNPTDYIKTVSPINWVDYNTPCPSWEKFLSQMFSNDQKIIDYIQRLFGYGITGLNTEHIFPVFWGHNGRNGKGTLFETLKFILGDFAYKVPNSFLMEQNMKGGASGPDAVTMGLYGKRIVWCSETNEKDRLDVAKLKETVGGDTISARAPHGKRQIEFIPSYLFLTITNRRPRAPANDMALWRRVHLIPLKNSFIDNPDPNKQYEFKADKKILDTLKKEASGILAWLVRGCLLWQEHGLKPPDSIKAATDAYRENEDIIGDFIKECCFEADDTALRVKPKEFYAAYKTWCDEVGHHSMAKKRFLDNIKLRFKTVKIQGFNYFVKIMLVIQ